MKRISRTMNHTQQNYTQTHAQHANGYRSKAPPALSPWPPQLVHSHALGPLRLSLLAPLKQLPALAWSPWQVRLTNPTHNQGFSPVSFDASFPNLPNISEHLTQSLTHVVVPKRTFSKLDKSWPPRLFDRVDAMINWETTPNFPIKCQASCSVLSDATFTKRTVLLMLASQTAAHTPNPFMKYECLACVGEDGLVSVGTSLAIASTGATSGMVTLKQTCRLASQSFARNETHLTNNESYTTKLHPNSCSACQWISVQGTSCSFSLTSTAGAFACTGASSIVSAGSVETAACSGLVSLAGSADKSYP